MRIGFALFAALFALAASGQGKSLPRATEAWKWTTDQRIAARLDPAGMAERQRLEALDNPDRPADKAPRFVIDGKTNPELFMPYELMTMLVVDSDPVDQRYRATYNDDLHRFGWDPDVFWNDVRSIAADYMRLQARYPRPTDEQSRKLCALRAAAMAELRQRYPRFDEFLYVAVAPRMNYSSVDIHPASWLAWVAGGCK